MPRDDLMDIDLVLESLEDDHDNIPIVMDSIGFLEGATNSGEDCSISAFFGMAVALL